MTRILVIGNSHTGPLLWSWHAQVEQERPDIDVAFFRGHTIALRQATVVPERRFGCLDPAQDDPELQVHLMKYNMRIAIDMEAFDAIIAVGWWNIDNGLIPSMLGRASIDGISASPGNRRISATAFDAILHAHVDASVPPPSWHNWQDRKLLHIAQPRRNETSFDIAPYKTIDRDALPIALDKARDLYVSKLADVGIQDIAQPAQTITQHGLSRAIYGRDANSTAPRNKPDYAHMNAAYGALLWREIFAAIGV